jgi:hypothetical protein
MCSSENQLGKSVAYTIQLKEGADDRTSMPQHQASYANTSKSGTFTDYLKDLITYPAKNDDPKSTGYPLCEQ